MARQAAQWSVVSQSRELSAAQRSHLADLDAKRRLMPAIRRGQVPAPEAFDEERERKLDDLRTAGSGPTTRDVFGDGVLVRGHHRSVAPDIAERTTGPEALRPVLPRWSRTSACASEGARYPGSRASPPTDADREGPESTPRRAARGTIARVVRKRRFFRPTTRTRL